MYTLHKLLCGHLIKITIVLFKAEDCSCLILPTVPHKMDNTALLIGNELAKAFKGGGLSSLQADRVGQLLDDFFEAHPFTVDIKWCHSMTERIGWHSYDMRTTIQHWRVNALIGGQATYEVALQDEEAVRTIGVFPWYGVNIVVQGHE